MYSYKSLSFLEQHNTLPPTNFLETLIRVEIRPEVHARIHDLIARKQASDELGKGAPDRQLNTFIEEQLEKWRRQISTPNRQEGLTDELERVLTHIFAEQADMAATVTKSPAQ